MRYLKGTIDYGLSFTRDHEFRLYGYTNSYWEGSVSGRKSTSGGCFSLGSIMVSLLSRKKYSVSLITIKVEYIAYCSAICESVWLQNLLSNVFNMELDATVVLCDNKSCMKMIENHVFCDKMKHIEIWYFYIRDMVHKAFIKLQYVIIDEQVADALTKPLSRVKFEHF